MRDRIINGGGIIVVYCPSIVNIINFCLAMLTIISKFN